jgi:outer membrane protein OmpA-like peptidoglycan-associated protein
MAYRQRISASNCVRALVRAVFGWALICAIASLIPAANVARAGDEPSSGFITNALVPKTTKTRGLVDPEQQTKTDAQKRFIDDVRTRSVRSISVEERNKVLDIAAERPGIDLQINFELGSAEIGAAAKDALVKLGTALRDPRLKDQTILVAGHTDGKGDKAYNQGLSERRAAAVRGFLVEKFGLGADRLVAIGYGFERLKNKDDPNAAENRRVQVVNLSAN